MNWRRPCCDTLTPLSCVAVVTIRAILLGLLGAVVVCGFTYFNDAVMRQTYFVGNNMPIAVYGGLILFILVLNPLLQRLRLALTGKELAVILALTLAACCVPSSGLMRTLTASLVMPHQLNQTVPGWKSQGVVEMLPEVMLVEVTAENENQVLNGFTQGLARPEGQLHIALTDVPWSAWWRTLLFWMPLILALWMGLIGLSVVLHRQWSDHEHLPYPLATFAHALLPAQGQARGAVFGSRLFWLGAIGVAAIHLNNFAYVHFPDSLIHVQTALSFEPLLKLFPTIAAGDRWSLFSFTVYPTVIAFAYFLATDVSLSLGLGPYLLRQR
jgi:hypothetical protein